MNTPEIDKYLIEKAHDYRHDPLSFVMFAWDDLEPRKWQTEILSELGEKLRHGELNKFDAIQNAVSSGHGIGKALSSGDKVPTPNGLRFVSDIKPGDFVFGGNGRAVKVNAIKSYKNIPFYKVSFNDKSSVNVSSGHLWKVKNRNDRRTGSDWQLLTTLDIKNAGVLRPNGRAMAKNWEIPVQGCIDYDDKEFLVDPYTYGVWLGDGDKRACRISNIDQEVWGNVAYSHKGNKMARTLYGFMSDLKASGLYGCTTYNASVHRSYIESSSRLEVLRGLLDTDGWVEQCGSAAFCSASKQLVDDVIEISRSLGLIARESKFKKNKCAGAWLTHITWNGKFDLFKIKRKQDKLIAAEDRYNKRWIASIEQVNNDDGVCFDVDGGLFLTKDCHVTHNSAMVAWIIIWAITTEVDAKGVVTANTENQLKTKTWAELSKWYQSCRYKHWFKFTATAIFSSDSEHERKWRIDMIPWSERNTESFAGLHNEGSRILVVFDEASAIPDNIWEVTEGALTDEDTEIIWVVFGNPTRNTGRFKECFGKFKHRWSIRQIDSRTVPGINKKQIQQWADDYGDDSDFFRVRVKGVFPRAGDNQFISTELCVNAADRILDSSNYSQFPKFIGVDVARFGSDQSVILRRQGNKVFKTKRFRGIDTMELAGKVYDQHKEWQAQTIFVDGVGVGSGVVDRLKELGLPVIDVQAGAQALDKRTYLNMRAELWGQMRTWIDGDVDIPNNSDLAEEISQVEYGFNAKMQIQIESKDDMKKRGLASPDEADALALTFCGLNRSHINTSAVKVKTKSARGWD